MRATTSAAGYNILQRRVRVRRSYKDGVMIRGIFEERVFFKDGKKNHRIVDLGCAGDRLYTGSCTVVPYRDYLNFNSAQTITNHVKNAHQHFNPTPVQHTHAKPDLHPNPLRHSNPCPVTNN
jgi:hypothetical protein